MRLIARCCIIDSLNIFFMYKSCTSSSDYIALLGAYSLIFMSLKLVKMCPSKLRFYGDFWSLCSSCECSTFRTRIGWVALPVKKYLQKLGWKWTPTMFIGQGCKVHLKKEELPMGTLIVSCSKHITVVKDGVLHDTYDCSRNGTRCVYGYWTQGQIS